MESYRTLNFEKEESICIITLNRPDTYNAINSTMAKDMDHAFKEFANDQKLRVAIVTGNGKGFMSGADLEEIDKRSADENIDFNQKIMEIFSFIENQAKPVIAAINGYAFGGGLELALACTFRLAALEARMGLPEVKLGLLPGAGGTQRLPRTIGKQQAMRLILTGETIDATEALHMGLIMEVVSAGELMQKAHALAKAILKAGPRAVVMAKDAIEVGLKMSLDEALLYTHRNLSTLILGEEMKEGIDAFLNKRPPKYLI